MRENNDNKDYILYNIGSPLLNRYIQTDNQKNMPKYE